MDNQIQVTLRFDKDLVKDFDEFAEKIGATRTGLLKLLMKQVINAQALPEISLKKEPGMYNFDKDPTIIK